MISPMYVCLTLNIIRHPNRTPKAKDERTGALTRKRVGVQVNLLQRRYLPELGRDGT